MDYKHLGLELHRLLNSLIGSVEQDRKLAAGQTEELVQWIEDRQRRG